MWSISLHNSYSLVALWGHVPCLNIDKTLMHIKSTCRSNTEVLYLCSAKHIPNVWSFVYMYKPSETCMFLTVSTLSLSLLPTQGGTKFYKSLASLSAQVPSQIPTNTGFWHLVLSSTKLMPFHNGNINTLIVEYQINVNPKWEDTFDNINSNKVEHEVQRMSQGFLRFSKSFMGPVNLFSCVCPHNIATVVYNSNV